MLEIIIIGENNYFGDEEICENLPYRQFTAMCNSLKSEIFKIDASVFLFFF
jgi:hypothetical protein